jgi:hypothetical protein
MASAKHGGFWMTVLGTVIGGIVVAITLRKRQSTRARFGPPPAAPDTTLDARNTSGIAALECGVWHPRIGRPNRTLVSRRFLSNFAGPDLKVVQTDLYAEKNGHSDFGVRLHNDGSDSVGNCWVYLEGWYSDGGRAGKISTVTSESFHVPANGDAVYPDSDRLPLVFRLNGRGFQGGGRTVLIVQCSGYAREWTIYDTLLPIY